MDDHPTRCRRRLPLRGCAALLALTAFGAGLGLRLGNDALRLLEANRPSVSHGTPAAGRLDHGRRLPTAGPNFTTYSWLGSLVGRTAVHGTVRDIVVDAYRRLEVSSPYRTFVYGETGWPRGGPFPPHKTHQNGLSVDFMVPVRDPAGSPLPFPSRPWNQLGYGVELDEEGRGDGLLLDREAMAAHLDALVESAEANGARVDVVIFDPAMQPLVAPHMTRSVRWSTRRAWVRHDEHYHVNFAL